jgi:large subunit ribosomal protein L35
MKLSCANEVSPERSSDIQRERIKTDSRRLKADGCFLRNFMPKLKTHKGAAKRFKLTGTGKVKRGRSHLRHILTSKSKKRKRNLGSPALVSEGDKRKVKRMIPYQ